MEVYRKPATARWYYDSAQQVDSVEVPKDPWLGEIDITFDGTKDKSGDRHTTIRIRLSEVEVERLYAGLVQGRKARLKELSKSERELGADLRKVAEVADAHLDKLQERWMGAAHGSEVEALCRELRQEFREALDKRVPNWRWKGYGS